MTAHVMNFHCIFDITCSDFVNTKRAGFVKTILHSYRTRFTSQSDFDINGSLDIYPLHIFSITQLNEILKTSKKNSKFQNEILNELNNDQNMNGYTSSKNGIIDSGYGIKSGCSNTDKLAFDALDIGAGVGLVTDIIF